MDNNQPQLIQRNSSANIDFGKCSEHSDETITNICLNKTCNQYFSFACPECFSSNHTEHSQKQFKSIKAFVNEINSLVNDETLDNQTVSQQKYQQQQQQQLIEKLKFILEQISTIQESCQKISIKITEDIEHLSIIQKFKDFCCNPKPTFQEYKKKYNFQLSQALKIDQSYKLNFDLDWISTQESSQINKLSETITGQVKLMSDALTQISIQKLQNQQQQQKNQQQIQQQQQNLSNNNNDNKLLLLNDLFQISDFLKSKETVKSLFQFSDDCERINTKELQNYQNLEFEFLVKGDLQQTAFIIGLLNKQGLQDFLNLDEVQMEQIYLHSNSAEKNKGFMVSKGSIKIEDLLKQKKSEIALIIKICNEKNKEQSFEVFNKKKTMHYIYEKQNNIEQKFDDLCFFFHSPYNKQQEFQLIKAEAKF